MRKRKTVFLALALCALMLAGCSENETGGSSGESSAIQSSQSSDGAGSLAVSNDESSSETSSSESSSSTESSSSNGDSDELSMTEGLSPVDPSSLKDGEYDITVDSSSEMFKVTACKLTVADGKMNAVITLSGTGYPYLFLGTGEQAQASGTGFINYVENADGAYTYSIPLEQLNAEVACSAFSAKKEKWYDRTLVFRADSLPADAFTDSVFTTAADLSLKDGEYSVAVTLEGGSGKVTAISPAKLIIEGGEAFAEVELSSSNYNYMKVDGIQYDMINTEGNSKFRIPVKGFDYKMAVSANTTAMSKPHEIDYTLYFDSATIE